MIIFVCTSNTCRSPMAEELARTMKRSDEKRIVSRSLTTDYEPEGSPANEMAQLVMQEEYGRDISGHRSKLLTQEDVDAAEVIVGVSTSHRAHIEKNFVGAVGKTISFSTNVPDPWRGPREEYLECSMQLKRLIEEMWDGLGK